MDLALEFVCFRGNKEGGEEIIEGEGHTETEADGLCYFHVD